MIDGPQAVAGVVSSEMQTRRIMTQPGRREALRQLRLQRILSYIDANIADPDLCVLTASSALGSSVRGLHLALAPERDSST